jgi:rubrerythrin
VEKITDALKTRIRDLILLDLDAVEAYDAAIARLKDELSKSELGTFRSDHERHVRDLSPLLLALGETPPVKGDFKRFLAKGKVVLGAIFGDLEILRAMWSNEDTTNQKYEEAFAETALSPDVRVVVERNLSDERRHRAWIIQRCRELEQGKRAAA